MTEQEFWKRYLQSQRFHERNAGIKSDDIFTRAHNEETRGIAYIYLLHCNKLTREAV